jgi:hypothetical protein
MATLPPTATTYTEFYSYPANNPYGMDEDIVSMCYAMVNEVWRSTRNQLSLDALHHNILADVRQLAPLD